MASLSGSVSSGNSDKTLMRWSRLSLLTSQSVLGTKCSPLRTPALRSTCSLKESPAVSTSNSSPSSLTTATSPLTTRIAALHFGSSLNSSEPSSMHKYSAFKSTKKAKRASDFLRKGHITLEVLMPWPKPCRKRCSSSGKDSKAAANADCGISRSVDNSREAIVTVRRLAWPRKARSPKVEPWRTVPICWPPSSTERTPPTSTNMRTSSSSSPSTTTL
mmetsp:Transcript_1196/g.3107  ORF Transcript_1196/g.3107 Transcript_1196/m.3107 type:complete len:218 (+) Transcript_1196:1-654(+)